MRWGGLASASANASASASAAALVTVDAVEFGALGEELS